MTKAEGESPDSRIENPLLQQTGLPAFDRIEPKHVEPAMRSLLADLDGELTALEADLGSTWERTVAPLEAMGDRLARCWGAVGHLMGVRNDDALREAFEAVQPEVVTFALRQGQSRPIHDALRELIEGEEREKFSPAQVRILTTMLRDASDAGVGLEDEDRERFNAIAQELAQLATDFSNRVLDATEAGAVWLRDPAEMAGTPESLRELAAQAARDDTEPGATAAEGPWKIHLDRTCVMPLLQHAERREVREKVYRAYVGRAGSGEFDNRETIERILSLRHEQAQLLGYGSYAELSLDSKMAPDVESVSSLLEELRVASYGEAEGELETLAGFAANSGAQEAGDLALWDVAFWAERLREEKFAYSEEDLRSYFPLPRVLEGLFGLAERLFEVRIEAADGEAPVWHEDVRFFRVSDASGEPLAAFYLDPYARPGHKRGGAWMDECVSRSRRLALQAAEVRLPVAYLVCNQAPPVAELPSLMRFDDVQTLFHEFGHGLQHMLTRVDESLASGIRNIEWDAVELPSQFMENWCYQRETIHAISAHVETHEPLPDDVFEKLKAARTYRAGSDMLRQIYFASTDMELHKEAPATSGEDAFAIQGRVAERTTVMPPLPEDRFLCSFGHIFAGGYAAGYYSYKWAEVLAADAFGAFEEAGLDNPEEVARLGRRFSETVLALGGSCAPAEVFESFRGRAPSPEALLRQSGLVSTS